MLLVVDDLQWADEATIDLLRFLLRRIAGTRSLILATYRADEPDPQPALRALLGDVARTPSATRVELDPLSVAAVTTLVGARHIDPAHLHRLTRGNSFFVTEVVSQDGDALPVSVRDAVLARTAGLDPGRVGTWPRRTTGRDGDEPPCERVDPQVRQEVEPAFVFSGS